MSNNIEEIDVITKDIRNININTEPFSDARAQTMECYKKMDSFIRDFQLKFNIK